MKALLVAAMIFLPSYSQAQWWWSSTPDCDDDSVEDTVIQLAHHEFAKLQFSSKGGFAMLGIRPSQESAVGQGFLGHIDDSNEYGASIKELAREVQSWLDQVDLGLKRIRRITTNNDTGSTYCAATLTMRGGRAEYGLIKYVAQHTSKEQEGVYVELTEY